MSDTPNATEKDFWEGPSGLTWIQFEEEQDTFLGDVAELVINEANPQPGDRVLDIGCGTGAVSLLAADRVGPEGRALATDISEPLLNRAEARGASLPQFGTHHADAEAADWPETGFDFAVSRFGVMFFANPPAAFANIAKALKPGGRIVFAAWAPAKENPYWHIPARRASERLGKPPKVEPDTPGPMGLSNLPLALERLAAAGLEDINGQQVEVALRHPGGVEAAADLAVRIGAARHVINKFNGSPDDEAAIRDAIAADFAPYATEAGAAVPASINLLTARVPNA